MTVRGKEFDMSSVFRNAMLTLCTAGVGFLVTTAITNRQNIAVMAEKVDKLEKRDYYSKADARRDQEIIELKLQNQQKDLELLSYKVENLPKYSK